MEKRALTQESQPGPSAPNFELRDDSDSESDLENENSDKQNSASAASDSSNLVMPPPKARRKKELTTEQTFSAIEVAGVQIKVTNVPLEVEMKLVNTTVERKESRSAWWDGELRRCLHTVSPDLVDVWDQMKWDTPEEKELFQRYVLTHCFQKRLQPPEHRRARRLQGRHHGCLAGDDPQGRISAQREA